MKCTIHKQLVMFIILLSFGTQTYCNPSSLFEKLTNALDLTLHTQKLWIDLIMHNPQLDPKELAQMRFVHFSKDGIPKKFNSAIKTEKALSQLCESTGHELPLCRSLNAFLKTVFLSFVSANDHKEVALSIKKDLDMVCAANTNNEIDRYKCHDTMINFHQKIFEFYHKIKTKTTPNAQDHS